MPNPVSILNLTGKHDRRPKLPYKPQAIKAFLDPALVQQVDTYRKEHKLTLGRSQAIAKLLAIALVTELADFSYSHEPLNYTPQELKLMLDPTLVERLKYCIEANGFPKFGRSQAIGKLLAIALKADEAIAKASLPDLNG
jgi:hypothetical protein